MRRRDFLALIGGAIAVGAASCPLAAAAAEIWPSRPITIIVPFGAGSGTDIVTRIIGQPLGIALGQNIVVDNRQGANGGIAATYVAKAPPDGYTLLMSTNSPHSANPFLLKNIAYDPVKDFAPVTRIGSFTLMLVINPALPVKTIPELIIYAKANPGKLTYGSGNTSGILAGETLKHWAGIDILQVPYKSVPPALNDVIAGRVSMTFTDLTPGLPHVNAGSLRALGITRLKRSVLLPDLPTFDESGLKDFEVEILGRTVCAGRHAGRDRQPPQRGDPQDRRESADQGADRPDRLRGVRIDAGGARRVRQGPAGPYIQDGQGRRHRAGVSEPRRVGATRGSNHANPGRSANET